MRLQVRSPVRALAVLLLVVPALAIAGVAAGFWTGDGGGAGSGSTASGQQPVVLTPAAPAAELYPGRRADVVLTAVNPNAVPVVIPSLRLDQAGSTGGFAVDPGHAGCGTSALGFTTQANDGAGWTVPGREGSEDGVLSITLPNALAMSTAASDACQGATITVFLEAGP